MPVPCSHARGQSHGRSDAAPANPDRRTAAVPCGTTSSHPTGWHSRASPGQCTATLLEPGNGSNCKSAICLAAGIPDHVFGAIRKGNLRVEAPTAASYCVRNPQAGGPAVRPGFAPIRPSRHRSQGLSPAARNGAVGDPKKSIWTMGPAPTRGEPTCARASGSNAVPKTLARPPGFGHRAVMEDLDDLSASVYACERHRGRFRQARLRGGACLSREFFADAFRRSDKAWP